MGGLAALRQYHFLNTFFLEFLNANFVMPTCPYSKIDRSEDQSLQKPSNIFYTYEC